jgi:hypothetical protein
MVNTGLTLGLAFKIGRPALQVCWLSFLLGMTNVFLIFLFGLLTVLFKKRHDNIIPITSVYN